MLRVIESVLRYIVVYLNIYLKFNKINTFLIYKLYSKMQIFHLKFAMFPSHFAMVPSHFAVHVAPSHFDIAPSYFIVVE